MRRRYLSFLNEQKKLAFGVELKKLKKLVKLCHIFHFFNNYGMNASNNYCGVARANSGGAKALREEALFGLDFSLVRFFSSMEKK